MLLAPGLRRYVIIPVLINVVLICALITLLGWLLGHWLDYWLAGLPAWLSWLESVLWWLAMILLTLGFCYFFTLLANLVASPFNGMLSARVEALQSGFEPNSGMTLAAEMWDGVTSELRRLRYYATRALFLLLLCLALLFIPVANMAIAPLWFIFGALMLAFEYLDLPMANRGMCFDDKIATLYAQKWHHLGFGSAVTITTAIPFINLIVMPAAVIGATLLYMERDVTTNGHAERILEQDGAKHDN